MYRKYFLIFEAKCKLFFVNKYHYGYNKYNQTITKVTFTPKIQGAARFFSQKKANQVIDQLPPTNEIIHLLSSSDDCQIKLSNLILIPITFNYDS